MKTRTSSLPCAAVVVLLAGCSMDPMEDPEIAAACGAPPFRTIEDRAAAVERGHQINHRFDCPDKRTFAAVEASYHRPAHAAALVKATRPAGRGATLREARAQFRTEVARDASGSPPLPHPPAALFVRADYVSAVGKLPAWVTPDPRDGEKHPAIVWLTGGDSNSLDDFWTEGETADDQSASAFRKAGVIMMFPTLRGGNANPGHKEFFYGEVDDVIAAADRVARLSYVDRVYLGGHSTGGTLALLVAECTDRFAAVFAFGPVAEIDDYPSEFLPVDLAPLAPQETQLRSPLHWLDDIGSPTYLVEGQEAPGNHRALEQLCRRNFNPRVHCVPVPGKDHFSVLDAAGTKLAARIVVGVKNGKPLLTKQEFTR